MTSSTAKQKTKNQPRLSFYSPLAGLGIASGLLAIAALIGLFVTGIIPTLWLTIATILSIFGLWVILKPLLYTPISTPNAAVRSILAAIIAVASIAILSVCLSVLSFLNSIQADEYSTETYSIIAVKSRSMTTEKATTAGLVYTDPYFKESQTELKNHSKATVKEYPTVQSAMSHLADETVNITTLNSGNLQLAKELYPQFDQTFEIIATFTIRFRSAMPAPQKTNQADPFAIYISGIDTHGAISTVSRSDVNILAIINPTTHNILLVNTPRDYYVQLHDTTGTKDKLTHAGLYGPDMSRQTLQDLYGIDIPYYVRINFSSLVSIVDAVGGIDVYSDYAFGSFQIGRNQLDGKRALQFSRERYSFSEGDRQRGRNQQKVIEALISKLSSPEALINYQSILNSTQNAVQTNLPPTLITSLANRQLSQSGNWAVRSIDVDGVGSMGPTYSMGDQPLYIMIPDEASVKRASREIKNLL